MAVLRDDPDRAERRRRAQDRADIMRIGDLVEHQQHPALRGFGQQVAEPHVLEWLDLDHYALVRRVGGDHPAEIGHLGAHHDEVLGEIHEARSLERGPRFQHPPLGIVERGRDRMLAPETRPIGIAATLSLVLARHEVGSCGDGPA